MTRGQFITQIEATQEALRRFLVALCCGDSQLADDIAQDACIKAYLSADSLNDPEKFKKWLFKIAYNTFLTNRSAEKTYAGYEEARDMVSGDHSDSGFQYQELYETLNRLPCKERSSVLLHYMEGYSIKEIAEIEKTSQDAVKQHLSRGRSHLRDLLSNP